MRHTSVENLFRDAEKKHQSGDLVDAALVYKQIVELQPDNAEAMFLWARIALERGNVQNARQLLKNVLAVSPDHSEAHFCLGVLKYEAEEYHAAIVHLQAATCGAVTDPSIFNHLGQALAAEHRLQDAADAFKGAISVDPDNRAAYHGVVQAFERNGQLDKAHDWLVKAKERFPGTHEFDLEEAVLLRSQHRYKDAINVLENMPEPENLGASIWAHKELGSLYDRTDNPEKAFEEFTTFNRLTVQAHNITPARKQSFHREIEACAATFTPEFVKGFKACEVRESQMPDFLVGFPRSGTTLLQQVLDAHTSIHAADEVMAINPIIAGWRADGREYPDLLAELDDEEIEDVRKRYWATHKNAKNWEEAKVFVDKLPLLMLHAGAIDRLFPDAKFIFAVRHPYDCLLSSFMQSFTINYAMIHFFDLDDIANLYAKLMDLWFQYEDVLNLNVHYVRYEDVVGDFQPTVTELLGFLGLRWQKSLLDRDRRKDRAAAIKTPSYHQVRQPIYDHARYRWHRYREQLEPYIEHLRPYAERFGYDDR